MIVPRAAFVSLTLLMASAAALLAVPVAPGAGTDYGCAGLVVAISCAGVDPNPECHRPYDRSDWGAGGYVFGGHAAAVGGTAWCGTQDNQTRGGRWMDAGYYGSSGKLVVKSEQEDGDPAGCTTRVTLASPVVGASEQAGCVVRPFHARDVLLP